MPALKILELANMLPLGQVFVWFAFGHASLGLMLAAARTLRVAIGHLARSARFAGFSEFTNAHAAFWSPKRSLARILKERIWCS